MTPVPRVFQHTGQRAFLLPGEQESPFSTSQTRLSIPFDNEQARSLQHWDREMGTDYFTTRMVSTQRSHRWSVARARFPPPRETNLRPRPRFLLQEAGMSPLSQRGVGFSVKLGATCDPTMKRAYCPE